MLSGCVLKQIRSTPACGNDRKKGEGNGEGNGNDNSKNQYGDPSLRSG
jgi:hypothetical protein